MTDRDPVPDWLTDMDKEILEVLSSGLVLTPSIISENIGRSRKGVSNRINSLQAGELVEKIDRGKYRITDEGRLVWDSIDGEKYRYRRLDVTERKMIQRDLGVSLEEYHREVEEEYEKLQDQDHEAEEDDDLLSVAFERAEERLKQENDKN
ncbi:hypothetical protein VB773_09110 [Haloarculaceae archaeon H-GB2-1]|nr:hypothetical protein [Haloarculaceae archaeon H-GB1-1]MEA5407710.1 hypothetical protein [Haloarculaceae archaeon H-GB2-1]